MRIVVDVGCAKYGGDESIPPLVAEFAPDLLIGLDGSRSILDEPGLETVGGTLVVRFHAAAWIYDGLISWAGENLGGHVEVVPSVGQGAAEVKAVNLAALLSTLTEKGDEVILKMDVEGAEYVLVPALREADVDARLALAMIEYHCEACGYGIWNWYAPHPGPTGCPANEDEWRARTIATDALLRCEKRGWNL